MPRGNIQIGYVDHKIQIVDGPAYHFHQPFPDHHPQQESGQGADIPQEQGFLENLAENLQRQGGFIPGIRPGRPTQEYITRVLVRITWGGAIFLGLIAVLPFLATRVTNVQALQISATGLLIVVGVVIDTMRQIEAQMMMRNYEGFIS